MLKVDAKKAAIEGLKRNNPSSNDKERLCDLAEQIIAQPIEKTLSSAVIVGVVQVIEFLSLVTIGMSIYFFYVLDSDPRFYAIVVLGGAFLANVFFNIIQAHRISSYRKFFTQTGRVLAAWSAIIILILVIAFLFKASELLSRVWLVSWFAIGALFLIIYRLALKLLIDKWTRHGKLIRRTVIVGGGKGAEDLIASINKNTLNDIELLGIFDDRFDERSPDEVSGLPKLGKVSALVKFARRTRVDLIIVSLPLSAEDRVLYMFKQLWVLPVDIRLSAHMSKLKFKASAYSYVGDVAVFDMADRPISDWSLVFKWVFDKVTALVALILLSPIMLLTAIAVKLDSKGPILFKQKRYGFNNEFVEIYKFRSMFTEMSDKDASKLATKNDPRVTKVGRFIRKTSIDELPQLFNVLRNELSMVGPRPHAMSAKAEDKLYDDVVNGYFARHKVKPGITGWAQINGWRGETDTIDKILKRLDHDLYYIENWSPLLDIYILIMTPISLFSKSENAY